MTQRTTSKRRPRQDPSSPSLKQRAADLRASMPARGSKASAPPSPQAAPDLDAVLVNAAADLQRLEAAIAAIPSIEGRSLDEAPGYADLDAEVERVASVLAGTPAVGLPGLQAKAKAILSDRFSVQSPEELEMAHSLARDVLSASPAVLPPRPRAEPPVEESDPAFALIGAHHAAFCTWDAAATAVGNTHPSDPGLQEARKATIPLLHAEERAFMDLVGSLPASLPGLMALADYLPTALNLRGAHEADDEAALALGAICASIRALVAKGKVVAGDGMAAVGANPDPMSDMLAADILEHWLIWAAEQRDVDTPAAERVEERRFALIEAAEALPATKETIAPKALALAWLSYVDNWRAGWTRDDHTMDGRLALDVHAAATGTPATGRSVRPAALKFDRSVSDRVDFASATLNELVAIHDTALLVGDVAQAAVWQGRCKAATAQNPYAPSYNAAGELMVWLSDELTHVEHLAVEEMKKRRPTDGWGRERRLAWIAAPIIQNGDVTETAAFIGELAAFLADEAKG